MRILLVSPFFPPQNCSASVRVHAFAKYWARAGEDVTVLTTVKREDQTGFEVSFDGFRVVEIAHRGSRFLESLRRREKSGAAVTAGLPLERESVPPWLRSLRRLREQTGIYNSVRMPDLTDAWVRPALAWALAEGPWDVVVSSAGPYTAHLVALELKKRGGASLWAADYRDLWTENEPFTGLFPFTVRERFLERRCHRAADLLVTVSEELAHRLSMSSGKSAVVIFNGHDEELDAGMPVEPAFPRDGVVRFVYTGALYLRRQDPAPLFSALASLSGENGRAPARFRLVVAGPGEETWARLARRHGLSGAFEHRGFVGRQEALRLQRDAQALLLLDWNEAGKGIMTSKLFEYLFATAPIFAIGGSPGSPIARLLEETGRGISVPSSAGEIRDVLRAFLESPERFRAPGAREVIRQYTRERQSVRFLEHLRELAAQV